MKKIIITFMFALFIVCVYKTEVKALSGSGTSGSPYKVTTGSDLKAALSKGNSSWKYIAIADTVAITETIKVETGKFRVYASGANRTIRRSQSMGAAVNSSSNPLKCIKLEGSTEIVWGYNATSYKLTLNGSKNYFTDSRQCNDFFCVNTNAEMTIGANCIFTNAKNTMKTDEAAPIRAYGIVNVYGEISNCEGNNGGAIKCISGDVYIYNGAKIHGCKSGTEGGGIYVRDFATIMMYGGSIYSNQAAEEGGGIFSTKGTVYLIGGTIYSNTAGQTGGGVFAGNASNLFFGENGSGPTVSDNYAKKSGGGVRCNGGTSESGGVSIFEGGTITENKTDVSGGGISVGKPSSGCPSKIDISNLNITYNTSAHSGGGINFSEGVVGKTTNEAPIDNCTISLNKSSTSGGGIYVNTAVKITDNNIRDNEANYGGGIAISDTGILKMPSSKVVSNIADKGAGIYQGGIFELLERGYVNSNNTVYLPSGRHIDITGKLTVSNILASYIDPEVKTKGTILVDVTYAGGTADDELYHEGSGDEEAAGKSVTKKFAAKGGYTLRPSNKNTVINSSRYIIISERYDVKYNANTLDTVLNLPKDDIAFWSEKYAVSANVVSRVGFILNTNKHWNLSADGTGDVMKPGVDTLITKDTTLYAVWYNPQISWLKMKTVDRYYVVGQDITLTVKELTKKIKLENDLGIDIDYEIKVTRIVRVGGRVLAKGTDIKTEDYINTDEVDNFTLYLSSSNQDGTVTCTGQMNVSILEDYYDKTEVRFISKEFIDTLDPRSKWNKSKKSVLKKSLNNEDDYIFTVDLEKEDIEEIRNNVKSNGHKIDHAVNSGISGKIIKQ